MPEHIAARQVPEPDEPLSRPKPTARLMPVLTVTLMAPASATRPEAVTAEVFDATSPLLIPIDTDAPLVQTEFDEAICTLHWPSNVALAAAGVASKAPTSSRLVNVALRDALMVITFRR